MFTTYLYITDTKIHIIWPLSGPVSCIHIYIYTSIKNLVGFLFSSHFDAPQPTKLWWGRTPCLRKETSKKITLEKLSRFQWTILSGMLIDLWKEAIWFFLSQFHTWLYQSAKNWWQGTNENSVHQTWRQKTTQSSWLEDVSLGWMLKHG